MKNIKNSENKLIYIILLVLAILIIIGTLQTSFAVNVTIDETNATGISGGISATGIGDTLTLEKGTYNKDGDRGIIINQNITIQGNGPADRVIIDGDYISNIITIGSDNLNVTFINLTFLKGLSTSDGGAVYNPTNSILTFINCSFINNTATFDGGAISNWGDNMFVIDSSFTGNIAEYYGGAIYNRGNNMSVWRSNFTDNTAYVYAGAIYNLGVSMTVRESNFTGNVANDHGGVIYNKGDNMSVWGSNFKDNFAKSDAVIANWGDNMHVFGSDFTNNFATWDGGAISNMGDNMFVLGSNFIGNTADHHGGAIANWGNNMTVSGSNFIINTATELGGAFFNSGNDSNIQYNRFVNNTDSSDKTIVNEGLRLNADFNWWGSNNNPNTLLVVGLTVNNFFVMALSVNDVNFTIINSSHNVSVGSYNLAYQLLLYTPSTTDLEVDDNLDILPDFLVNLTWFDKTGAVVYNLTNVNAKGAYSYTVPLARNGNFTLNAFGDNEDFGLNIHGELLIGEVNLTLTKTVNVTDIVVKGQTVTYTITLSNGGPDDGYNVFVNEILPSSLVILSANATKGSYSFTTGVWNVGNLFNGENAALTIIALVNGTGKITNFINVTTDDINTANNKTNISITGKILTNATINIPNKVILGKTVDISGRVMDNEGMPLSNITLKVKIDGKTYSVKTDDNGNWVLAFTPSNHGNIEISVSWSGDENRFGFINATTFYVKKLDDNDTNKSSNYPVTDVSMKKTGVPLIAILLVLICIFSTTFRKK